MYLLLAFAYRKVEEHISSLISFSSIYNMWISVNRSNFKLSFSKAGCHANPGAETNFAGSSLYISMHLF